ncbi:Zn-ribbon domain-containing protein [Halomicrobium salinisoli]|uniref:Zn-ribbon domain-containing protein n=1 Tax=Halomicrobium salinisoli TaxID=2878391 RepID=UPI001CF091BD|nr:Zn-ribbon domain-containing protein [Halomicrobium salinisoli]
MPHQCTNCGRTFDDGSKQMLSGCPDCGGNKFQFKPDGGPAPDAEPPEPPEPAGSSVARTVGKTAATVKDFVSSSDDESPSVGAPESTDTASPEVGTADATSSEVGTPGAEVNGAEPSSAADRSGAASARSPPETEGSRPPAEDAGRASSSEPSITDVHEDSAQASARSEVIAPDEIPSEPATDEEHHFDPVSTEESTDSSTGSEGAEPVDRPDLDELREELNDQFESIKVLDPGKYELNLMELYDREEYIIALREDGRYSIQVPENFRE